MARDDAPGTRGRDRHAAIIWMCIAAFCIFFAVVYARFGHGVTSPFMTWMFLIPLIGGSAVYLALSKLTSRSFPRASYNAYNSGLATLATGSALRGVFEIAGTSSAFLAVYVVAGVALILFAVVFAFARHHA